MTVQAPAKHTQHRNGLSSVQQSVVVRQGDDHDRSDHNLAVDDDGLFLDGVNAEDGGLRHVQAARGEHRRKDASMGTYIGVPKSEPKTPPLEMVNVPPAMSSKANLFSRACRNTSADGPQRYPLNAPSCPNQR